MSDLEEIEQCAGCTISKKELDAMVCMYCKKIQKKMEENKYRLMAIR